MNNKTLVTLNSIPTFNLANFNAWISSSIDELIFHSNEIEYTPSSGGSTASIGVDTFYIPEGLGNVGADITTTELQVRQDVKRRNAYRLSQATINEGLVIFSQDDQWKQYFSNSVVLKISDLGLGSGYIRYGFSNFTANQANNPFVETSVATNFWFYSFFKIDAE